jgi:hypothetical protein
MMADGQLENDGKRLNSLLTAAESQFLRRAYTATTMDVMAVMAKMSKKAPYEPTPSKVVLFDADDRLANVVALQPDVHGQRSEPDVAKVSPSACQAYPVFEIR